MTLTFLHTADWQLGKPFASIGEGAKRHRVQQERLHAVQRLREVVEKSGVSFVLVAGDLFDSSQATKATVSAACAPNADTKTKTANATRVACRKCGDFSAIVREHYNVGPNRRS